MRGVVARVEEEVAVVGVVAEEAEEVGRPVEDGQEVEVPLDVGVPQGPVVPDPLEGVGVAGRRREARVGPTPRPAPVEADLGGPRDTGKGRETEEAVEEEGVAVVPDVGDEPRPTVVAEEMALVDGLGLVGTSRDVRVPGPVAPVAAGR